jgi:hypothetical protein
MSEALLTLPAGMLPGAKTYITPVPQPADIEFLVQWALSKTGTLPWSRDRDRELAFDKGLTVKPRKRPPVNWTIAVACAGMHLVVPPLPARLTPSGDAETILSALKTLPPRQASLLLACARNTIRPDWTVNGHAEPVRHQKKSWKKKKGHKKSTKLKTPQIHHWYDPTEEAICAAREAYTLWYDGMWRLLEVLQNRLSGFRINGFAAPEAPWLSIEKKSA